MGLDEVAESVVISELYMWKNAMDLINWGKHFLHCLNCIYLVYKRDNIWIILAHFNNSCDFYAPPVYVSYAIVWAIWLKYWNQNFAFLLKNHLKKSDNNRKD